MDKRSYRLSNYQIAEMSEALSAMNGTREKEGVVRYKHMTSALCWWVARNTIALRPHVEALRDAEVAAHRKLIAETHPTPGAPAQFASMKFDTELASIRSELFRKQVDVEGLTPTSMEDLAVEKNGFPPEILVGIAPLIDDL